MAYLLDANVFIQAKNLHYGLDFCPAFWDWLIANNASGSVFSIEKVGDEIEAGADDLATWAKQRGPTLFLKPDAAIVTALGAVSAWASGQTYEPAALSTFLQVADYYLVAQALANHQHRCHARNSFRLEEANQNSERLHRSRAQIHDAIRDAAARASAVCPWTIVTLQVLSRGPDMIAKARATYSEPVVTSEFTAKKTSRNS